MVWIAELGMPRAIRLYELEGSIMDVFNDEGGIGCRLKWKHSEREIVLYDSELSGRPLMLHEAALPDLTRLWSACQSIVALVRMWLDVFSCGPGPCTHYLKPLGRYPIVGGEVQLPIIHALQRAGQSSASPFGILSGVSPYIMLPCVILLV